MNPQQKALLTAAWEALGPERVTRGLQASGHTWNDCFLALATYGEAGVLGREMEKRWRREHYVGTLLGVRVELVNAVVRTWDHDEGAFRALAAEWLELNRTAVNRSLSTVGERPPRTPAPRAASRVIMRRVR